ncbi:MAG: hypothetical protein U0703_17285 [Anaerolineae bacterium]
MPSATRPARRSCAKASTPQQRLKLILETTDYVLAVRSIRLDADDKAELIRRAYSRLFGYGPLDALFLDERVTTIALNGADRAAVRYGHDDDQPAAAVRRRPPARRDRAAAARRWRRTAR